MRGGDAGWSSKRVISPSALRRFGDCPHRVRLRYIDDILEPKSFKVDLSKGRITHELMAASLRRIRQGSLEFGENWCFQQVERRLPPHEFPSPAARQAHARDVAHWVTWGLNQIDRTATILRIEKGASREVPGQGSGSPLRLYTRPDLVLLHDERDGPLVEFIDFKTGREYEDHLVPAIMGYVFTNALSPDIPPSSGLRMRFTWYWLAERRSTSRDLTLDYSTEKLEEVRAIVDRLLAEREWRPQPSHLCHWCPYRGNPCTALADAANDAVRDD